MNAPIYLFTARGIPVYAQTWYFLLVLWYAFAGSDVRSGLIFAFCATGSILVHEFGHAVVASRFRLAPSIVLHGWGGLCAHSPARRDRDDALIIAAGPSAGLVLGGCVFAVASGLAAFAPTVLDNEVVARVISDLLFLNIAWSLVNLLPLWPLDGGQLFRLGVMKVVRQTTGDPIVHGVGLAVAAILAVLAGVWLHSMLAIVLALMLGWQNLSVLAGVAASPSVRPTNSTAGVLAKDARKALADGNAREALRIGHQIRAENNVPDSVLAEAWTIIVLASAALGRHDDVASFGRRAPQTPPIIEARARSLVALGRPADATRILDSPEGRKLAAKKRAEILGSIVN